MREEKYRAGITLIELLLVVVIMGIAVGMATPYIARSYRAAKLRTASRTIVMANRYARSTAVLHQIQTALLFDLAKNEIEMVTVGESISGSDRDRFLDARGERADTLSDRDEEETPSANISVASRLRRALPEGVKILSVISEDVTYEYEDIFWVNYYPNGMCDDYSVRLQDEDNKRVRLDIDPLSGKATVEYEYGS